MANLTISVDADILRNARIRALEEGTSVNRYLAEQLNNYARERSVENRRRQAAIKLVDLSARLARKGDGHGWTRDELWEDTRGGLR